jgi:hypothetical protein
MGDLNEKVGLEPSGFSKIPSELSLIDIMPHFHPMETEVTTYARGAACLDYVFCTTNVHPSIRRCGMELFNGHFFSDHRSIFVDWNKLELFGALTPPMAAKAARRLLSPNLMAKGKYLLRMQKYYDDHKILERLQSLERQDSIDWKLADSLD